MLELIGVVAVVAILAYGWHKGWFVRFFGGNDNGPTAA